MKGKHLITAVLTATVLLTLFGSCASAPSSGAEKPAAERPPAWVTSFPADSAYYVGVGSSKTGNQAEDSEIARKNAYSNLAAQISTTIKSETEYRETDAAGDVSRSVDVQIREVVDQNLQAVEVVDSYNSSEWGAWYYVRLNKAKWAEIQTREMRDLEKRVKDLVSPVLADRSAGIAERLTQLAKGWKLVAESAYTGMIKTELAGESGSLIDLLEKQIGTLVNSLTVEVEPASLETEAGRPARLSLNVTTTTGLPPGQLNFIIRAKDGAEGKAFSVVTGQDGRYSEDVGFSGFPVGKSYLNASLDLLHFGIHPDSVETEILIPQRDFLLDIRQQKAELIVGAAGDLDEGYSEGAVYNTAKALFSKTLPVKIEEGSGDKTYTLNFNLQYRNAPPNDYGFVIIYVKGNLSVMRGSKSIFTYETPEVKGGGLNWSQANTKALDKLFADMELDSAFIDGITGAFSLD